MDITNINNSEYTQHDFDIKLMHMILGLGLVTSDESLDDDIDFINNIESINRCEIENEYNKTMRRFRHELKKTLKN